MLRARCHSLARGWEAVPDITAVSQLLTDPGNVVWMEASLADVTPAAVATIAEELGLHPLAVEDALHARQRPKLEAYEEHLFAVMHQLDTVDGQLEATQIACFIGRRFVLCIHEGAERTLAEAERRTRMTPRPEGQGPSFFMHALLDAVVDDYQVVADGLEAEMESLEEVALAEPGSRLQGPLYSVKQRVSRLRRYVVPGERVLAGVGTTFRNEIGDRTRELIRDVHDHALRIIDQIHNVDALSDAVIDLLRAEQANQLNEATKRLSGWAAIIAAPTVIASVYGMNFRLYPGNETTSGFWFAVGLMVATAGGLYTLFKRKGWL